MDASRETQSAGPAGGAAEAALVLLFGALAASAGHGLFLYARLTRHQNALPNWAFLRKVTGELGFATIVWFLGAIPLALLALLLHRWLLGRRWLPALALAVAAAALLAFTSYARLMGA